MSVPITEVRDAPVEGFVDFSYSTILVLSIGNKRRSRMVGVGAGANEGLNPNVNAVGNAEYDASGLEW